MTKKELFIKEIENANINFSKDAQLYFELFKSGEGNKPAFTENGKKVLSFIKANKDSYNNMFKAKDIANAMGITSKTVSGASRKLVTDGYLEKIGENPVIYSITDKGITVNIVAE